HPQPRPPKMPNQRRSSGGLPQEKNSLSPPPRHPSTGSGSKEPRRRHDLFEGRKRLGDNGLIVVEEAASERRQSHRENRQDGDHTHYTAPATQDPSPLENHVWSRHWWRNCNSAPMTCGQTP